MTVQSVWLITAKTNLHVGSENTSGYGLIDNAVQRDVLTGLPCINASSLKGAINEYCTQVVRLAPEDRQKIFGVDKSNKKSDTQKGAYTFFDAGLLLLPVQDDNTLYHWVTSMSMIKRLKEQMDIFGINIPGVTDENTLLSIIKEQYQEKEIVIVNDTELNEVCSDTELPIIARNCLENGQSTNLWYEQVLPPQTVFYTFLLSDEDKLSGVLNNKIIQIGANATIGYGYCRFTKVCRNDESKK
jgi:CRISPR-associated protein Cmr4